jgi:dGTPase
LSVAFEAACLAHDLGHPPFGHVVEEELDRLAREKCDLEDGFEGNAQSFRIVTRLAKINYHSNPKKVSIRDPGYGMNLTRMTLNAMLKYPWLYGAKNNLGVNTTKKWGVYNEDREWLDWCRPKSGMPHMKTLEAEIMDWADDVAFALHDLSDFYRSGRIPLERLAFSVKNQPAGQEEGELQALLDDIKRRYGSAENITDYKQALVGILEFFPIDKTYRGDLGQMGRLDDYLQVFLKRYITSVSIVDPDANNGSVVKIEQHQLDEVAALKEILRYYVIFSRDLAAVRFGQRRLARETFEILHDVAVKKAHLRVFPKKFQDRLEACDDEMHSMSRVVLDYVAGMTERQMIREHRTLSGLFI